MNNHQLSSLKARTILIIKTGSIKKKFNLQKHKLIRSANYIDDSLPFPLVIKPAYGSSSAYVVKVENKEELNDTYSYIKKNMSANIESALSDGLDILVEEYIDGDEVDIDILL